MIQSRLRNERLQEHTAVRAPADLEKLVDARIEKYLLDPINRAKIREFLKDLPEEN